MNNNGRRPSQYANQNGSPNGNYNRNSQKSRPQNGGINISFGTILLVICFALAAINFKIFSSIITGNESLEREAKTAEAKSHKAAEPEPEPDPRQLIEQDIKENFVSLTVTADDTKHGNLILINAAHPYEFEAQPTVVDKLEPVTIPDSDDASYWVKSNYETFSPEALENLDLLLHDFAAATGIKDIMVLDTYRSYEDQQNVLYSKIQELGEEEGRKIATNPGYSEHHTNLAVDITRFDGAAYYEYDGTGEYSWIPENCANYGFIVRYPENKSNITGIIFEPWHLRYVGVPHSLFITQSGLCYEEYIELLKKYTVDSQRFEITANDGTTYVVYYCETPEGGEIKVPKNAEYTLSGTNDGGMIVTYKKATQSTENGLKNDE